MFSLIITILSIALVAALALATLYFGGASFLSPAAHSKFRSWLGRKPTTFETLGEVQHYNQFNPSSLKRLHAEDAALGRVAVDIVQMAPRQEGDQAYLTKNVLVRVHRGYDPYFI